MQFPNLLAKYSPKPLKSINQPTKKYVQFPNSSKNEITYKLFSNKSCKYISLNMCQQMTDVKLWLLYSNT